LKNYDVLWVDKSMH